MSLSRVVFSKASDEWATPQELFDSLNAVWRFTLDPCATAENATCARFYTKEQNGLLQDWSGERVFMNPPYSKIVQWLRKAWEEGQKPDTVVVCLLPSRTDTKYWWDYVMTVWPHGIQFVKGRLKFGGMPNSAPFPSVIVTFRADFIHQRTAAMELSGEQELFFRESLAKAVADGKRPNSG